ncbi:SPW repeat protein [Actinomadura sp. DC4]|uniref:SPW repeat protein n=1 Tax=Actinomadura sp. DC4 TaxID=3055069 RepID=UPI0025AFC6B3|nr:SPW repeat protein [Actinomadura sp. DC4]MDN3359639.1 SPW repeat protein [Actinomadura sp. DC4]
MAGHPDAAEMRERYARMMEGRRVEMLEGLVILTGLYMAISPWVVHFRSTSPDVAVNDLIVGLALAIIGLGLMLFPERALGLGWMLIPIGIWLIILPWVASAGHSATRGIIWNNLVVGIIVCLLGAATAAMAAMGRRRPRATRA